MYIDIAIPGPFTQCFTYCLPENVEEIQPGTRVVVPFRHKPVVGFVVSIRSGLPDGLSAEKIKTILAVPEPQPVFSPSLWKLICWISNYYFAPLGEVCRGALPKKLLQAKESKTGKTTRAMEDHSLFHQSPPLQLTAQQKQAIDLIFKEMEAIAPKPILLHGITGSGKTEIYLQFLHQLIAQNKQAIFLVPEIGLTPQLIGRVQARIGERVAVYHSSLTDAQRFAEWKKMKTGEVHVVVGTRSALFAPFTRLGGIVVDEEQDSSYKQEEGFFYHARDAAIVRAKLEKIPVVLGSATPQIETFVNAQRKKYHSITLSERATGAKLPRIALVDLRDKKERDRSTNLSKTLQKEIEKNLQNGEQTLLFLNRRGFAHFLLCEECGHAWRCLNCDVTLTYHHHPLRLVCHYCGLTQSVPEKCPACQGIILTPMGDGTQRLEAELEDLFPRVRIARLDRDAARRKAERGKILREMQQGKIDILVGTQMVTKGHDFPEVTLVGVVNADVGLHLPDFRAQERMFQQLMQVAGRAGRAQKPGRVVLQTYQPEHECFSALQRHDYTEFVRAELAHRETLLYPPFSRLVQIRLQGVRESLVKEGAEKIAHFFKQQKSSVQILGPAPAPLAKLQGKFRWQLLLKSRTRAPLESLIKQWRDYETQNPLKGTHVYIDIDPVQMM